MAGGCTAEGRIPWANPGTDSQLPANCAGNLVSVLVSPGFATLRLSRPGGKMDGFGEAAAALQAFPIELSAQCGSGCAVMHVEVFEALAGQVGTGVGDGAVGDESAAQRDVAHQFAGARPRSSLTAASIRRAKLCSPTVRRCICRPTPIIMVFRPTGLRGRVFRWRWRAQRSSDPDRG